MEEKISKMKTSHESDASVRLWLERKGIRTGEFDPDFLKESHLREWILPSLTAFKQQGLIEDVIMEVSSGKEATVYSCLGTKKSGFPLLAAKVYRPRIFRSLSNDALYREGRWVSQKSVQRAINRRSTMGHQFMFERWINDEYSVQKLLWNNGIDVPKPIVIEGNTILMEYIGDENGPAPLLRKVKIPDRDMDRAFRRTITNIRNMLGLNVVHGDLSAFNLLWWGGKAIIIDMAQAVDSRSNPNAELFFKRDMAILGRYFKREEEAREIADSLWLEWETGKI